MGWIYSLLDKIRTRIFLCAALVSALIRPEDLPKNPSANFSQVKAGSRHVTPSSYGDINKLRSGSANSSHLISGNIDLPTKKEANNSIAVALELSLLPPGLTDFVGLKFYLIAAFSLSLLRRLTSREAKNFPSSSAFYEKLPTIKMKIS